MKKNIRKTVSAAVCFCVLCCAESAYADNTINVVNSFLNLSAETGMETVQTQSDLSLITAAPDLQVRLYEEGVSITLGNSFLSGEIRYRAYLKGLGWQDYVSNGELSGLPDSEKQIEAVQIELGGKLSEFYQITYQAHVKDFGWMDPAYDNEVAGAPGSGRALDDLKVELIKKDSQETSAKANLMSHEAASNGLHTSIEMPLLTYRAYDRKNGWLESVQGGITSGDLEADTGIESFYMQLENSGFSGDVEYCAYQEGIGWEEIVHKTGELSGDSSGKRLEAVQMRLTGELAEYFNIFYRVYSDQFGWSSWVANGEKAGAIGYHAPLKGIQAFLSIRNTTSELNEVSETAQNALLEKADLYGAIASASGTKKVKSIGSYTISESAQAQLEAAIGELGNYDCGFVMIDIQSGSGVSYNPSQVFYSASSIKGPYVLSLCAQNAAAIEKSENMIKQILQNSSNESYDALCSMYGFEEFKNWQKEAGVSLEGAMNGNYADYNAKTLARFWVRNYDFFESGATGEKVGSWMENPNASAIHETLGERYKTRTKAGWIANSGQYIATCDGGVIYSGDSPYLIAIMSDVPSNMKRLYPVIEALESVHMEMIGLNG